MKEHKTSASALNIFNNERVEQSASGKLKWLKGCWPPFVVLSIVCGSCFGFLDWMCVSRIDYIRLPSPTAVAQLYVVQKNSGALSSYSYDISIVEPGGGKSSLNYVGHVYGGRVSGKWISPYEAEVTLTHPKRKRTEKDRVTIFTHSGLREIRVIFREQLASLDTRK